MAKKQITSNDLAVKIDQLSSKMSEGFVDNQKHADDMFARSMKHTDDALEQIILPRFQNIDESLEEIKENITEHHLQTNQIDQKLH